MEEQGEGGEVLLPASLRDRLAGAISEAIVKTSLAGTLCPGAAWRSLVQIFGRYQMHRILS